MRLVLFIVFLAGAGVTLAQTPETETGAAAVSPSESVITIHGLCENRQQAAAAGTCTTVVTRQQFETVLTLLKATSRNAASAPPLGVAEGYTELMVYGEAARRAGAEEDPRYQQILDLTRLRALGDVYRANMEDKARQVSAEEIKAWYEKNISSFEELSLRRIFLPKSNSADLKDQAFSARAKQLAKDLRERAAKGEDMDKLQKEALETLGIKGASPTIMGALRRGQTDASAEKEIFALKPGQVSNVMENPSIYIVYKLEGRRMLTIDDVRGEISAELYRQKTESLSRAVTDSVHIDYNKAYFGPSAAAAWVAAKSVSPETNGDAK